MNQFTIYCSEEQTNKALQLGAPIKEFCGLCPTTSIDGILYDIPTTEQMLGWLKTKGMKFYFNDITSLYQIVADTKIIAQGCFESKELAAIDAALEYLKNNRK